MQLLGEDTKLKLSMIQEMIQTDLDSIQNHPSIKAKDKKIQSSMDEKNKLILTLSKIVACNTDWPFDKWKQVITSSENRNHQKFIDNNIKELKHQQQQDMGNVLDVLKSVI